MGFLKHLTGFLQAIPEQITKGNVYLRKTNGEMYIDVDDDQRVQVNPRADWEEEDEDSLKYIENKPVLGTVTSYDVVTSIEQSNKIPTANAVYNAMHDVESDVESLKASYGAPLLANGIAEMTETDRIYVYVGDEVDMQPDHWYYYDGTDWVVGGVYMSASVETDKTLMRANEPADAKAVGDILNDLQTSLLTYDVFSTSKTYAVGDYVLYNGLMYRFTTAHSAGAWNASHVIEIKIMDEVSGLKDDLNYNKTVTPGYLLRATNTGKGLEWSPVGLPSDEQTANAVTDWLDNHPEATTTVQDGSFVENKFSDDLKLKTIKDYVTPEMFGAVGDGVADDTLCIQDAINSGAKHIVFTKPIYRTSTITVNDGCDIDCNNASFILKTGSIYLFLCGGSIAESSADITVTSGEHIQLEDDYTGVGMVYSDDSVLQTREYLKSGFLCSFYNGKSLTPSLFDISNACLYKIASITVNIRNIKNVTIQSSNSLSYIIYATYCKDCCFENINSEGLLFCGIWLYRDINTVISDCNIKMHGTTAPKIGYSYGISCSESASTLIKNCYIYNSHWHSITTSGGTDAVFCYDTIIENCKLYTSSIALAFLDHDNGFYTQIKNCIVQGVCISAGGSVENSIILAQSGSNHNCLLEFQLVAIPGYNYVARDIQFVESENTNRLGFVCIVHGNDPERNYYGNIYIDNAKNAIATKEIVFDSSVSNGIMSVNDLVLRNLAVNIRNTKAKSLCCEYVGLHKDGNCSTIGTYDKECEIEICKISNSNFTSLLTTGRIYMNNCDSNGVNMRTASASVFMVNCRVNITSNDLRTLHWQGEGLLMGPYALPRNIYIIDEVAYNYIPSSSGYTVTPI